MYMPIYNYNTVPGKGVKVQPRDPQEIFSDYVKFKLLFIIYTIKYLLCCIRVLIFITPISTLKFVLSYA